VANPAFAFDDNINIDNNSNSYEMTKKIYNDNDSNTSEEEVSDIPYIDLQIDEDSLSNISDVEKKNQQIQNELQQSESNNQDVSEQNWYNLFLKNGYVFEKGIVKNQRFTYFMHGGDILDAQRGNDLSSYSSFAANEFQSSTAFRDDKTWFDWGINFSRKQTYNSKLLAKFSYVQLTHQFNEHQKVILGNCRVQNGIEGGSSSSNLRFVARSQIARTFGNSISDNIRNKGTYKYFDYDIGISDASRYWQNVFQGFEVTAIVSGKPLAKYENKYGKMKLGTSISHGKANDINWTVPGAHLFYENKNFGIDMEYQYANGYAGTWYSRDKAHGLYTTLYYYLTPKIQLATRYDYFKNFDKKKNNIEYTVGINYWFTKQCKFMVNYMLAKSNSKPQPSHKVYIGVDFTTYSLFDKLLENL
jgi:hypothetical protein